MATSINSTSANTPPTFEGVVVYTIGLNGCLNGFYTNNAPQNGGRVFNEIARRDPDGANDLDIPGTYTCSWIDLNNQIQNGSLIITPQGTIFDVQWQVNNAIVFRGRGYRTQIDQLVVVYQ